MKKLLLFVIFPSLVQAATLAWDDMNNEHNVVVGYRLYWKIIKPEACPNDTKPKHSVEVGKDPSYNITEDPNFVPGLTYEFTVAAYNTTGESSLSEERVCYTFPGAPEPVVLASLDSEAGIPSDEPAESTGEPVGALQPTSTSTTKPLYRKQSKRNLQNEKQDAKNSISEKSDTKILFSGFTPFNRPNGAGSESDIYVGTRPSQWSRWIHPLRQGDSPSGPATDGGEADGAWFGPSRLYDERNQHTQNPTDKAGVERRQDFPIPVGRLQNGQRHEAGVGSINPTTCVRDSSGSTGKTNESAPHALKYFFGLLILAGIFWFTKFTKGRNL